MNRPVLPLRSRLTASGARTAAIAAKEMIHISRDMTTLYLSLGLPLVLLIIFGFGISFDLHDAPVVVVDQDGGIASTEIARSLESTGDFKVIRTSQIDDVEPAFRTGRAMGAIVIPAGFQSDMAALGGPTVQTLVDGSDGTSAGTLAFNLSSSAAAELARQTAEAARASSVPVIDARVRPVFNPGMESAVFLVPGLIALVLSIAGIMMTALTVAREWERGNMEQLFSTPVGRAEVIVGKLLPYQMIGMVQALMVVTVGVFLFDVPFRGSVALLFAGTMLFLGGVLGLGLLVSTVTRNQQVATQVGTLIALLPTVFLSGFMFPVDRMPTVLQVISNVVPARYFIAFLRGVMLRGDSAADLAIELAAMSAFCFLVLAVAVARFPRRVA